MNVTDPGDLPQSDPTPANFRSALLLGEDHTELEEVAITEVTPNLAIGISRGRFPKGYPHVDPNEDAVYAATDGTTTVLVVADGHQGFDAARAAIDGDRRNRSPRHGCTTRSLDPPAGRQRQSPR